MLVVYKVPGILKLSSSAQASQICANLQFKDSFFYLFELADQVLAVFVLAVFLFRHRCSLVLTLTGSRKGMASLKVVSRL